MNNMEMGSALAELAQTDPIIKNYLSKMRQAIPKTPEEVNKWIIQLITALSQDRQRLQELLHESISRHGTFVAEVREGVGIVRSEIERQELLLWGTEQLPTPGGN